MLLQLSEDLLVGADQAAAFTGLSRRTIYYLVDQNEIPFRRVGARLYFRKSALDISFGAPLLKEHLVPDNQNHRNQDLKITVGISRES